MEATPENAQPWKIEDNILLVLLALCTAWYAISVIQWHTAPAEDALMLLRYSRHLAAGHGIVWNIGDHPVEGATDFLYMVIVAGAIRLFHSGPIITSRIILLLANAATVALTYAAARKLFHASRVLAVVLALYLLMGPGVLLASNSFSPPLYALAAMGAWWFGCAMLVEAVTTRRIVAFSLLALVTGLIRPDGVLLAAMMTLAIAFGLITSSRRKQALQLIAWVVAIFAVLGGAYFLWRFHYFGYLLPNPFYKKGGGHLHRDGFHQSTLNTFKLLFPLIPFGLLGLLFPETRRRTIIVFFTPVLFSLVWILLSSENNAYMRFQYITLPLTLMCFPWLLAGFKHRFQGGLRLGFSEYGSMIVAVAMTIIFGGMYWKMLFHLPMPENGSGAYDIAQGLSQWKDRHYTIIVTEAGVIPYFTQWRAIDAWGLNDSVIEHDKRGLTDEYLDANHPAIIMFHLANLYSRQEFDQIWNGEKPEHQDPQHFMEVLANYAASHNYELAARWGDNACSVHVWYVRRDLPEADSMIALIRKSPHFFLDTQMISHDYRNESAPTLCSDPGIELPPNS